MDSTPGVLQPHPKLLHAPVPDMEELWAVPQPIIGVIELQGPDPEGAQAS